MNANGKIFRIERALKSNIKFLIIIIGLLVFSNYTFAATFYIDPTSTATGTPNGTITNPYKTWDNIVWVASSSYLQKRGTECIVSMAIKPTVSYITLGAYGTGARPKIKTTAGVKSKGIDFSQTSLTVNDLELYSTNDIVCAIILGGTGPFLINNCVLHDFSWGMRVFNITGKLTVSNTEIYDIGDDGFYSENTEDIEIFGCYVHSVNADLPTRTTAGGDCVQITGAQGYLYIHDNVLDHSAFGRKFCIIIGSAIDGLDVPSAALIEKNILIGFQSDTEVTSGVYLKESISNLIFRNNIVKDASTGLWANANITASNNIFIRCWQGITLNASKVGNIYNNTFVNNITGVNACYGSTSTIYNNIFVSGSMTKEFYALNGTIISDYNCFSNDGTALYGGGASTLAAVQTTRNRDLHSMVADPKFVNFATEDFHLTSTSPCIDKGKIITEITKDKDGVAIAKGAGPDIGAFEYIAVVTATTNKNPIIQVTYEESIYAGIVKTIDASQSYDPDKDAITFKWIAPKGISLSSTTTPSVQIVASDATLPSVYSLQLQVSDGKITEVRDITLKVSAYKPDMSEIKVIAIEASTFQSPNYPENIVDGNITSRWAALGTGQWLCFEMESKVPVNFLKIKTYEGSTRKSYFDIYASNDKVNWESIMIKSESCGFSTDNQVYSFNEQKAANKYKYIKLVGKGSNVNNWNSMYEFHIFGDILNAENAPSAINDKQNQEFKVFPNPASVYFSIKLDEMAENLSVQVIDLNGKVVLENNFTNISETQISAQSLKNGVYYVRLSSDKEVYQTQKLIIQ